MYVLPTSIVRITARFPDQPFFPYYQGRAERLVIVPGVGVALGGGWSVGVAANFLAGLTGGIEAGEGATRALEARVDEVVPAVARLVAGVTWRPRRDLAVAAVYRQRFEVPFQTTAETEVAGEPIDLDLAATGQFSPHQVAVGATWRPPGGAVHLDLGYARWSTYPGALRRGRQRPAAGRSARGRAAGGAVARHGVGAAGRRLDDQRAGHGARRLRLRDLAGAGRAARRDQPARRPQAHGRPRAGAWRGRAPSAARACASSCTVRPSSSAAARSPRLSCRPARPPAASRGCATRSPTIPSDPATQGAQISNPGYPGLDSGGQVFSGGLTVEVGL
jgi:hypothetical protein